MTVKAIAADFELFERSCPDCHKPIMWAKTNASDRTEWMPLDFAPAERGNVLAYPAPENARLLVCDVLDHRSRKLSAMRADGWLLFSHHRVSCPFADRWARQNKSMRPRPTGVRAEPPRVDTPEQEPAALF